VCGGGGFKSNLATCEIFDVQTQQWALCEPMRTYRHALAVVPLQSAYTIFNHAPSPAALPTLHNSDVPEKSERAGEVVPSVDDRGQWGVCAVGGWINGSVCSTDLEIFNFSNRQWYTAASMKHGRRLLGAAAFNGELYVFGGNCDDGVWYTAAAEKYTPWTNEWTTLKDLPCAGPTSAIAVGDVIYVFMQGKRVVAYHPSSDSYSDLSALPEPEWYSFDVTTINDIILVHGGAVKGDWAKAFYAYDTRSDSWLKLPDMSACRRRCAAALV
jgi:N-acetylneuraminic acid mutarotase